ncbi:normocyte-binding protein 1, partial [Francisella tularensis subsp. holarctica]|nr:normocyte-binding protein 1 [Francisella tularensis subsp. holarctica]
FLEKINAFFNKYKSNYYFFSLIREQFEIEDIEKIDSNKLSQLSITPYDILYIVDNQDVKVIAKYFSFSNRGNIRANIIGSFNDAT